MTHGFNEDPSLALIDIVGDVLAIAFGAALIIIVLAAGFNRTANRALAIFFVATLVQNTFLFLSRLSHDPVQSALYDRVSARVWFLDSLILLPFLANYPEPRPWLPRWSKKLWPYLAGAAVFEALAIWNPGLAWGPNGEGPLAFVDFVADLFGSTIVPIFLGLHVLRGDFKQSLGPILIGTVLASSFVARDLLVTLDLFEAMSLARTPWETAATTLSPLRFAFAFAFVVLLGMIAVRRAESRKVAAFGIVFVGTLIVRVLYRWWNDFPDRGLAWTVVVLVFYTLLSSGLLAYALIRDEVVGFDRKLRLGLSRSAVVLAFLVVFLAVAEVAQNFFSQEYGYLSGGIVAAILLFAIAPLQRAAETLMGVRGGERTKGPPTADLYREAVTLTLADRRVSPAEELHLAHLAQRLGIGAGEAMQIRLDVQAQREAQAGPKRRPPKAS